MFFFFFFLSIPIYAYNFAVLVNSPGNVILVFTELSFLKD